MTSSLLNNLYRFSNTLKLTFIAFLLSEFFLRIYIKASQKMQHQFNQRDNPSVFTYIFVEIYVVLRTLK